MQCQFSGWFVFELNHIQRFNTEKSGYGIPKRGINQPTLTTTGNDVQKTSHRKMYKTKCEIEINLLYIMENWLFLPLSSLFFMNFSFKANINSFKIFSIVVAIIFGGYIRLKGMLCTILHTTIRHMSVCLCDSQSEGFQFSFILNETFSKSDSQFSFLFHSSASFLLVIRWCFLASLMSSTKVDWEYALHLHLFIPLRAMCVCVSKCIVLYFNFINFNLI